LAAKLKNLRIRKVDFVDEGANPDAHIGMIKRRGGEGEPEGGGGSTGSGNVLKKLFAFIGRAAGIDQSEIDSAVDEIQKGGSMSFTERINAVNAGKIADEIWDICYALQSSFCSILNDEDLDSAGAAAAMQESLDEFCGVVKESAAEWSSGKTAGIMKRDGGISEAELRIMKSAVERLNESIKKASVPAVEPAEKASGSIENRKGEGEEMKIDKSRLTDAERAFLESIEKRYGTEEGGVPGAAYAGPAQTSYGMADAAQPAVQAAPGTAAQPAAWPGAWQPVGKSMPGEWAASMVPAAQAGTYAQTPPAPGTPPAPEAGAQAAPPADDVYKGLHPAVRAELESLRKFREAAEERELAEAAAKYEIIGKKKEELIPLFKSLKAAGGTAYDDMIAVLDQTAAAVEKSGIFSEIGKSGHGGTGTGQAEAKIQGIAKGYMEKDPALGWNEAVAKAWEDNPDIIGEYDEEAGF